jgi:hypothetical protein
VPTTTVARASDVEVLDVLVGAPDLRFILGQLMGLVDAFGCTMRQLPWSSVEWVSMLLV